MVHSWLVHKLIDLQVYTLPKLVKSLLIRGLTQKWGFGFGLRKLLLWRVAFEILLFAVVYFGVSWAIWLRLFLSLALERAQPESQAQPCKNQKLVHAEPLVVRRGHSHKEKILKKKQKNECEFNTCVKEQEDKCRERVLSLVKNTELRIPTELLQSKRE